MFISSTLLALVLATPDAAAWDWAAIWGTKRASISISRGFGFIKNDDTGSNVAAPSDTGEATAITADITSDSGSESVDLTESDAWLHGAATIKALPTVDADLTLTLYDEGSASLLSFSGTLSADGTARFNDGHLDGDDGHDDYSGSGFDIEVLTAELFPNPDGGYQLSIDFNGADAYDIAYADVRIDEGSTVTTCDKRGCTTTGAVTTTKAEVGFDAIGAIWEGELSLDHEGEIEIDATSFDLDGKKLEKSTVTVGQILHTVEDDYASGHSMLSAGDAGSVAVRRGQRGYHVGRAASWDRVVVISDNNWTATTAPTHATVELDGGETLTIPANSYQVTAATPIKFSGSPEKEAFQLAIDGVDVKVGTPVTSRGICAYGRCFALAQGADGGWTLSATAYESSAAKLPKSVTVTLTSTLKAAQTSEKSYTVSFEDDVAVVFANEVAFAEDPLGLDLGGEVSLLGAADKKGKQKTVAKGDFQGSFVRTSEGELTLGAVDKNDIQAKGDILIGGEPIDFEKTDTNGDGVIEAPPVILMKNGTGTRNTANNSSQTQQSQLL